MNLLLNIEGHGSLSCWCKKYLPCFHHFRSKFCCCELWYRSRSCIL